MSSSMPENNDRTLNVTISAGTIFKAAVIVLCIWFLFLVKDVVLVVLTSIVLASSIEPAIIAMKRWRVRRVAAVIIIYLVLALVASSVVFFFLPSLIQDTAAFLSQVPKYIDTISLWNPLQQDYSVEKNTAQILSEGISEGTRAVGSGFSLTGFMENLTQIFSDSSEGAFRAVSLAFGGLLSFILIIVLSFYLAVQENGVGNFLSVIVPDKYEPYILGLWKRVEMKIGYWFQGQLLLGVLVGVLVYLFLAPFGVQNAIVLAVIAGVLEIIPLFGPILAAIPALAVGYVQGGISMALIIAGVYIIIHQFENHLIYPMVVKKIIGVPPIIVIVALIIGGELAGFLGLFLSVPIATLLMEYFNDLQKRKLNKA
ncbi:MAG: AI-2E family transporter [Candidatus Taylorbacteria bacterium]|nr:AI-2E family transporter [Candidatus Taylorbacteria bacterium]